MCAPHWRMVPKDIQQRVWAAYQFGQESGAAIPSAEWHAAADEAICAVAHREAGGVGNVSAPHRCRLTTRQIVKAGGYLQGGD